MGVVLAENAAEPVKETMALSKMMIPLELDRRKSTPAALSLDISKVVISPQGSRKLPRRSKTFVGALRVSATTLHRRGISRDRIDHPLPEKPDDIGPSRYPSYDSYGHPTYSETNLYSGRSSPTNTDSETAQTSSFSAAYDDYAGITTGRSTDIDGSIYSLGEDEFDRQASQRVRHLFEEIDSMLFENSSGPQHLSNECHEWVTTFPHYRLLGKQLVPPLDLGFQVIPQDAVPDLQDVTEQDISNNHAHHELSVLGHHVEAMSVPYEALTARSEPNSGSNPFDQFEEEVFAEDGVVEDVIAVDYKSSDDDLRSNSTSRRQRGIPPVTPQACVKDNISGAAFDYIWSESLSWLRPILIEFNNLIKSGTEDEEDVVASLAHHDGFNQNHTLELSSFYSNSRENSLTLINSSRLSDNNRVSRLGVSPQEGRGLDGLLTISSKALQNRQNTIIPETGEGQFGQMMQVARPNSSYSKLQPITGRPGSSFQQRQTSATARGRGLIAGRRLPPMQSSERARTPNVDEAKNRLTGEVVQGHRLTTITDNRNISSPPLGHLTLKPGPLPPISGSDYVDPADFSNTNNLNNKKSSQRASSAVHKETHLKLSQEKSMGPLVDNRPSTTHALYREATHPNLGRSDTPVLGSRRSSTPMAPNTYNSLRITPQGNAGLGPAPGSTHREGLTLGITGSSINPHSEAVGAAGADIGDSVQHPIEDLVQPSRWGNSHLHPQIRRAKQQHYNMPVR